MKRKLNVATSSCTSSQIPKSTIIEVRFALKLGELVVQDDGHKKLETHLSPSLGLTQRHPQQSLPRSQTREAEVQRRFHVRLVYFKLRVSKYFWRMSPVLIWLGDHATMEGASLGCQSVHQRWSTCEGGRRRCLGIWVVIRRTTPRV